MSIININYTQLLNHSKKISVDLLAKTTKKIKSFKSIFRIKDLDNSLGFNDLAPVENADKDKKYDSALLWALKNKKIKNIAVTGPYGSGKSSVLRTFEKNHKEFKYLNISLSTFKTSQNTEAGNSFEESQNSLIEKSILQQIFYKVKKEVIPYSRFKRIKNVKFTTYIFKSAFVTLWFASIGYLYDPYNKIFQTLIPNNSDYEQSYFLGFVLFAILGIILALNEIFCHFSHSKLNKISITSGEIGFEDIVGDSVLNKHLDEILYFFEKTSFNVVVIEDLDRFEEIDIFIKLREINSLINNSDHINRNVVFIYAIKDDIFSDANRTKFFDFIIPIIPVINSSNSGEILLEKLSSTSYAISTSFIKDLTLYIDDMRMLKNIYNEFVIYKEKLSVEGKIDLNLNKLFGFIVYKNKYPSDFAALNENKGLVAEIFNNKNANVTIQIVEIEDQLIKLEHDLKLIENEKILNIKDLRRVYIAATYEKIPYCAGIDLSGTSYGVQELLNDEQFEIFKNEEYFNYYTLSDPTDFQSSDISFKDIEKFLSPKISFAERENLITQKANGALENIKQSIESLNEEIRDIKSLSIKSLTEQFPSINFFDGSIKEYKLLVYLIRNGYIDEMYQTFISYFYEGTITKDDRAFILSIKDKESLGYEHTLVQVSEVLSQLKPIDFRTDAILNFSLLNFLLQQEIYNQNLNHFISYLINGGKKTLEFIDAYIENTSNQKELFFKKLSKSSTDFWSKILNECDYSSQKNDTYFRYLVEHSELDDLINMNENNSISNYLVSHENFLELIASIGQQEKIKNLILNLKIQLTDIQNPEKNQELFQFIFENNLYDLNQKMIELVIRTLNLLENDNHKVINYTAVLETNNEHLINNIENNINEYVSKALLKLDKNYTESEKSLLTLLNNDSLKSQHKTELLNLCDSLISDLSTVNDLNIRKQALAFSKVKPIWKNILIYFVEDKEIDETLITFLNNPTVFKEISKEKLTETAEYPDEIIQNISFKLIKSDELSTESFPNIVKSINYWYKAPSTSFSTISEPNLKVLIENHIFHLNEATFNWLAKDNNRLCAFLVEQFMSDYLTSIALYPLDIKGFEHLLSSAKINKKHKIELINNIGADLIDQNIKLSKLAHTALSADENLPKIEKNIFEALFRKDMDFNEKLSLLACQIDYFDKSYLQDKILEIGEPISNIFKNQRPKLLKNSKVEKLAKKMKDLGIISSFNVTDKFVRLIPKKSKK
ncbi:MAG: hypothetical protein ACAH17_02720 [Candidatus Paceibacterota bacterium]